MTSASKKFSRRFRIKFPTKRIFRIFIILKSNGMAPLWELIYQTTFVQYTVSQKNLTNIFNCKFKKDYQVLIIFGTNIPETTDQQMTVFPPHSMSVSALPGEIRTIEILLFLSNAVWLLNQHNTEKHILFTFLTFWLTFCQVVHFSTAYSETA